MNKRGFFAGLWVSLVSISAFAQAPAAKPENEFVKIVQVFLARDFVNDWDGVEKLPLIRWASLPPTDLQNCLPDGSCFARQGAATIGGRNIAVIAAGARTFPTNLYLRNGSAAIGETVVLAALRTAGFSADLARCPVPGSTGGTNWYRLKNPKANPGVLSIQTACNGTACEGFVLSHGGDLPAPQPNQVKLYSESCGPQGDRKPISTLLPHEALAQAMIALIPSATGVALYEWKTLTTLSTQIQWLAQGARKTDLSFMNDPNPMSMSGTVKYAGRQVSPLASGSDTQVKAVHFEEAGLHPRGEDLLAVLRTQGFTVQLARCGPVYTESTENWYRVTSAKTRPIMLKASIRRDGNQDQSSYTLRLDNTLPTRDARDRDPGVGGCQ